ncbi:MAG: hypothetical protein WD468_06030 [Pirellulales bacterium]
MWNRMLLVSLSFMYVVAVGSPTSAAAITIELFPLTGEMRLSNPGTGAVPLALYSILSPSGALDSSVGVWTSITGNYDFSGNHLVDPINNWNKLSMMGSTTELSEGVFADPGGSLPPTRAISLGYVWDVDKVPYPDWTFDFREPNEQQIGVSVEYTLDGDFSGDGTVDFLDYSLYWRPTFGSTTNLIADANLNGVVDAADYVVWRNNLGLTAPLPPYAAGAGLVTASIVVPEPTTGAMLVVLWMGFAVGPAAMRGRIGSTHSWRP